MQLPERVMMALVQTPAMFAVPNCINKGFAPPFIVRVGVVSAVPTQIKATIAGYVLQKEQVGPLVTRGGPLSLYMSLVAQQKASASKKCPFGYLMLAECDCSAFVQKRTRRRRLRISSPGDE